MARVLIVDDDPSWAVAFREAVRRMGHDAQVCTSGQELLAREDLDGFDLITLDVAMPGTDGIQLANVLA